MILTGEILMKRIISDSDVVQQARGWWSDGQWDKIGDNILIDPFRKDNLEIATYDLSVGHQYVSLRDPFNVKPVESNAYITVGPGETVLLLTEEYMCLPRNVMGVVVPRARRIFEGSSICATRVDPSWYGKLLIGFTNLNRFATRIKRGEAFCACYFIESAKVDRTCHELRVSNRGRENIHVEFPNIIQLRKPLRPDEVTKRHLDELVEQYGPPFDIIRGSVDWIMKEIQQYIDKEVAPNIAEQAANQAMRTAYDRQNKILLVIVGSGVGVAATYVITTILKTLGG